MNYDPMLTDVREDRLPKWARQAMERLRSRVRERQGEVDALKFAVGPTDVFLDTGATLDLLPLPKHSAVRFRLGPGPLQWVRVKRSMDRTGTKYVEVSSGDSIMVAPEVSNVLQVRARVR